MTPEFANQIDAALGPGLTPDVAVVQDGTGDLASCFAVADLAVASMQAAARELAALTDAREVVLNRRLAQLWFGMTLRPDGWQLPNAWDPVAGDYRAADGWIRLHTNAPHHRDAALEVLGCAADRNAVAEAVGGWDRTALESAVVAAGGAAAAMHGLTEWAAHPQGQAVASEPLIAWQETGPAPTPVDFGALRVLDLTRVLAGPVATRFLAGFGARVLRIDPPDWNEPGVEPEVTLGKRRAGLNLHRAEDRRIFEALLSRADVLVHGYRPGSLDRLGYDPARRQDLAPGQIDVSLNAYGWSGPWQGRRGFDSLVQMSTGIADAGMRQKAADRPVPLPVQALDHATGYLMAAAVLRALRHGRAKGTALAARVSLARTAALLLGGGLRPFHSAGLAETAADLAPATEATHWGPARRVTFPLRLDGRAPDWAHPAGPLRVDPPEW